MVFSSPRAEAHGRREYRLTLAVLFAIVLLRSAVFVFWERSHFDADQAITGLMAKHLAELRAFPVFWYGQSYMLAVESWIAAPVFLVAGASVTTLKLPLLAVNLAIVWLLLRGFVRDAGLRPAVAAVPALFVALPAPGTAARFLEANGGNVEPLLYVLLIWTLRNRPAWCGFVLGIGFLQREFTLYGFAALLLVEALRGELFTREGFRKRLATLRVFAEVWLLAQWVKRFSSGAGPGTTLADVYRAHDNVTELVSRMCLDAAAIPGGLWRIATQHWPVVFGTERRAIDDFGVVTAVNQGSAWTGAVLLVLAATAVAVVVLRAVARRTPAGGAEFCGYLVATAGFSILGYAIGKCGVIDFHYTRYELLSVLGMAGLAAWFLRQDVPVWLRRSWLAAAAVWFAAAAAPHARLLQEYVAHPPPDIRRVILAHLDAGGHRYALSDYWIAYPLTFLADERIIVASTDFVRIQAYQDAIDRQPGGVVTISRERCDAGRQIIPGVYLCGP